MANRFPLTLNKTTKKLEEIPSGETLDITGCGIVGGTDAEFSGTVEAQEFIIDGSPVSTLLAGDWNTLQNKPTALSSFTNDVGFITSDTDAQTLGLIGSSLSIIRGNTIDLSTLFALTLDDNTNVLSIAGGNSVDLSKFLDDTDAQTLTLVGNTLSISNGNSIDLTSIVGSTNDTLDDVTSRGATTTNSITVGGLTTDTFTVAGTGIATLSGATNIVIDAAGGTGDIIASGSNIKQIGGLSLTLLAAAPTVPAGTVAVADGTNWDPATKSGAVPYPVFYDGVSWNALY